MVSKISGFSLLELLLSIALGAILLTGIMSLMHQFNRHKLLAQILIDVQTQAQVSETQIQHDLQQICDPGLVKGSQDSLQLWRHSGAGCQLFDYNYDATSGSWRRRRQGGRFTPVLGLIESMQLTYGIDTDADCYIDQWFDAVPKDNLATVQQVRLQLQLWVTANRLLRQADATKLQWHEHDDKVLYPLDTIWIISHASPNC